MYRTAEEFVELLIQYPEQSARFARLFSAGGESGVLLWLCAQQKPVFAMDISARFGLTPGRVANIVKGLEVRGWIERRTDGEDQRRIHILPTEAGRQYADTVRQTMIDTDAELFRIFGQEDARSLMEILKHSIAKQ